MDFIGSLMSVGESADVKFEKFEIIDSFGLTNNLMVMNSKNTIQIEYVSLLGKN